MKLEEPVSQATNQEFIVGGVKLARPFRIRRLGHFGLNVMEPEVTRAFYCGLLGFRVADPADHGSRLPEEQRKNIGPTVGYFTRHGTDHHSFVFFPRQLREALNEHARRPSGTINQITWQVGSLQEVSDAFEWFKRRSKPIHRAGRDLPGSNWHFYPFDPDGHINELYYGIEQIGWDGHSKPRAMYGARYERPPQLPHKSEYAEVTNAMQEGIAPTTGWRATETGDEVYDVGGVLLARPFKVVRVGPVRIFVNDVEQALAFYRDDLGLTVTEEVTWRGHRCVFLRANTEHHSIALYPIALRTQLELNSGTTLFSFGLQLGSYSQLREAIVYLKNKGVTVRYLPPALFPGIDYCAFVLDPDGYALQLYYYMEQIGWDGAPRPASLRPKIDNENWPEFVVGASDTYLGEAYLGPLG